MNRRGRTGNTPVSMEGAVAYPKCLPVVLAAALGAVALAGPAGAVGRGRNGAGDAPSASAADFDPVQEYQKGVAALKANDYKAAARSFGSVSEAAPKNPDAWYMLGLAKAGLNDVKAAARAYQKAVGLDPSNIAAHQELAVSLARLKQTDKARAELGTLRARADACADACPDASSLKAAVAAVEAAIAGGSARLSTPPGLLFADAAAGDRAYVQAVELINQRRYPQALQALAAAQKAFGPHPDVLTYIGYVHRRMGDYEGAEGYYRQALSISPDHRGAAEYYGELKVVRGDMAGAAALLARLDAICAFGCAEAEELRRWVSLGREP
jgi:tetratricopeptide (TPR) repeat protein